MSYEDEQEPTCVSRWCEFCGDTTLQELIKSYEHEFTPTMIVHAYIWQCQVCDIEIETLDTE
jgi:hypothetical protein